MGTNILILLVVITGYIFIYNVAIYIFARAYRVRVEKFFVWYDIKFALFKIKIGDTIYGMGWFPLGGYLKMSGMTDESIDGNFTILPHYFLNLSSFKQAIVCVVGPLSCLFLGMGIYVYYNNASIPSFFTSVAVMIGLVLIAFLGITEIAKRVRMKNSIRKKLTYYLVSVCFFLLLLVVQTFCINRVIPLFEIITELIQGERFRFLSSPTSTENIISLTSGFGVFIFFGNILPVNSLIGSTIVKAFYIAFTGDISGQDMSNKYDNLFSLFSIIPIALYVYMLYKIF